MNNQVNPMLIGIFVVSAVALLTAGVLVFSSGKWFVEKQHYVVYFDESVNGLNIGAPVKLSGVKIGKVTDIKVRFFEKSNKVMTPVFIEIEPDKAIGLSDLDRGMDAEQKLAMLIKKGLRMQLQLNSLLTGQLYIEALVRPDTPVNLTRQSGDLLELPSIKSSSAELQKAISESFDNLQQIPFQSLFADIKKLVENLNKMTESEEIPRLIGKVNLTLDNTNQLIENTDRLVQRMDRHTDPLLAKVSKTIVSIDTSMQEMQTALQALEQTLGPDSQLNESLDLTLNEMAQAARSGRVLMDYLEQHPEALIRGKQDLGYGQ